MSYKQVHLSYISMKFTYALMSFLFENDFCLLLETYFILGFILIKCQENTNNVKYNILSFLFCENDNKIEIEKE